MDDGYYSSYYQHQAPMAPEVLGAPEFYTHYQQHVAQRSKSPTSLVNHTGLSPGGPLSSPPVSRDASRGPDPLPSQYPGQVVDDDSPSDSPTSLKTPDTDSVEEFTLDAHLVPEAYQANGDMMAAQVSQGSLPIQNQNMFFTPQGTITDQGMHPVIAFDADTDNAQL